MHLPILAAILQLASLRIGRIALHAHLVEYAHHLVVDVWLCQIKGSEKSNDTNDMGDLEAAILHAYVKNTWLSTKSIN